MLKYVYIFFGSLCIRLPIKYNTRFLDTQLHYRIPVETESNLHIKASLYCDSLYNNTMEYHIWHTFIYKPITD
jgi:hypothetical protein